MKNSLDKPSVAKAVKPAAPAEAHHRARHSTAQAQARQGGHPVSGIQAEMKQGFFLHSASCSPLGSDLAYQEKLRHRIRENCSFFS